MTDINRIPRGWLNLLGVQTSGKNPNVALETVQPVTEMSQLLYGDRMSSEQTTFTPTTTPQVFTHIVPSDEIWILFGASMSMNGAAPNPSVATWDLNLRRFPNAGGAGGQGLWSTIILDNTGLAAGATAYQSTTFPVPLVLQGGVEFLINHRISVGALHGISMTLLIARLNG